MKKLMVMACCLATFVCSAQVLDVSADSIPGWFKEFRQATKPYYSLWNQELYGSLLLVNPETREVYTNEPDSAGMLVKEGAIFKGMLPNEISFANTAVEWNGTRWAMIMLPLPEDKATRINLLAHESFHRLQPSLHFVIADANNGHLDTKDGRIYFRFELEALKKSIAAPTAKERKEHLTNAFIFRKYRNQLFPHSAHAENALELNEGLAEYTGQTVSGLNKKENAGNHFTGTIEKFQQNVPSFVRSFAYQTIPAYGYLLRDVKKEWNKEVSDETNLTDYFIKTFHINVPEALDKAVEKAINTYNGAAIMAEEAEREEKNQKLLAGYRTQFITQPHFDIALEKMQFAFDPRSIVPLDDKGTVYPHIQISDVWGILTVEKGALIAPNWNKVTITAPTEIGDKKVAGDGWILELSQEYILAKDGGSYEVKKQ
jgi:hypothetical protein